MPYLPGAINNSSIFIWKIAMEKPCISWVSWVTTKHFELLNRKQTPDLSILSNSKNCWILVFYLVVCPNMSMKLTFPMKKVWKWPPIPFRNPISMMNTFSTITTISFSYKKRKKPI